MDIKAVIRGDFGQLAQREIVAGKRAVKGAMTTQAAALKSQWRANIVASGLGAVSGGSSKLGNAIRSQAYPIGDASLNSTALVWSKAPKQTLSHETGATIQSKDGFWLAIPLPAAGRGARGARITPGEWEARRGVRLRFVYRSRNRALLVADGRQNSRGLGVKSRSKTGRGTATVPIFILVYRVRLKKVLNLEGIANAIAAKTPSLVVANWRD